MKTEADDPPPSAPVTPAVLDVDLETPHGREMLAATAHRYGAPLAVAAHRFDRLFLLRSPWAPGLRFVGGTASQAAHDDGEAASVIGATNGVMRDYRHSFSLSGPAETLEAAFASCIGEGIELLSQVERPGDCALEAPLGAVAGQLTPDLAARVRDLLAVAGAEDQPLAWLPARRLSEGGETLVPADWCLRRRPDRSRLAPPWRLGSGVAAGPTWETAASRALLELIERDAVALWWTGGRRARPLALHHPAAAEAARLAAHLRQGASERLGWMLDLTTDLGVPCVAALSTDRNGRGLACGFAARMTLEEAVRAALLENAQMELALMLASTASPEEARSLGDGAGGSEDPVLVLATRIDADSCCLLHPAGAPRVPDPLPGEGDLERLGGRLARLGLEVVLVEHSRPDLGIPVVRAISPGLQAVPSSFITHRLQAVMHESGGLAILTRQVPIF